MKRRQFITLLGGAAATWPLAARAQQRALPVIGYLSARSSEADAPILAVFRAGLNEAGFVEGQNVAIEYRSADQYDRLPALAVDLVRRQVSVIATGGIPAALAAKAATTTIPIVFAVAVNPVEFGLVASLNRPGGNLTGVASLGVEVGPKRLELMRELVPAASIIAVLVNPTNTNADTVSRDLRSAARILGVQVHVLQASTEHEIEVAFASTVQLRAGGLVIGNDPFLTGRIEQLAALALRHAVPTIYQFREFVAAGGLMSYGDSITDRVRLFGVYTGRILKGEKPADLPVQRATKVELIINLKTAKALGITVPQLLLGRADEIIE